MLEDDKLEVRFVRFAPAGRISLLHVPSEHPALVPEPAAPVVLLRVHVIAHQGRDRDNSSPECPGHQGGSGEGFRQSNVGGHFSLQGKHRVTDGTIVSQVSKCYWTMLSTFNKIRQSSNNLVGAENINKLCYRRSIRPACDDQSEIFHYFRKFQTLGFTECFNLLH